MMAWCVANCADERKAGETEEQFLYKTRKKAIGPFKRQLWTLPDENAAQIAANLRAKFGHLFDELGIAGTRELVERHVTPVAGPAAAAGGARRRGGRIGHGRRIGLRGRRLRRVAAAQPRPDELPQDRLVGQADQAPGRRRGQRRERLERAFTVSSGPSSPTSAQSRSTVSSSSARERGEHALDGPRVAADEDLDPAIEALGRTGGARRIGRRAARSSGSASVAARPRASSTQRSMTGRTGSVSRSLRAAATRRNHSQWSSTTFHAVAAGPRWPDRRGTSARSIEAPLLALRQRQARRAVAHPEGAAHLGLGQRTVGDEQVALDRGGRRRDAPRGTDLAPGLRERPSQRLGGGSVQTCYSREHVTGSTPLESHRMGTAAADCPIPASWKPQRSDRPPPC